MPDQDISAELRDAADSCANFDDGDYQGVMRRAADEIDRLRALPAQPEPVRIKLEMAAINGVGVWDGPLEIKGLPPGTVDAAWAPGASGLVLTFTPDPTGDGWVSVGQTWKEFRETLEDHYLPPGSRLRVQGEEYLVGDINGRAGSCDCCEAFRFSEVVEAWIPPAPEDPDHA